MKNILSRSAAIAALLLYATIVSAGPAYLDCSPFNPCNSPCGTKSLWTYGGWLDAGIYANEYGQKNAYDSGVLTPESGNTSLLQNVRQSDPQLNQAWLYFGKKLSGRGFDVGGRIDLAYGTDARYLQSSGLERKSSNPADRWGSGDYYFALPQLYGEIGYNNVSVKIGKVFNPLGYESLMSPDRFFYSYSHSLGVLPHTLTGVVGMWHANPNLTFYAAWGNGEKFFDDSDDNAFVGGFVWKANKQLTLSYGLIAGEVHADQGADYNYFMHSYVANYAINKRWNYVFEWTLRNDTQGGWHGGAYGINQELFYRLNRCWTLGLRADWMHWYRDFNAMGNDDAFALTFGANWKPTNYFTLRPEIRYDVLSHAEPFNLVKSNGLKPEDGQFSGGISAVLHF